jgi:hypothetical protein
MFLSWTALPIAHSIVVGVSQCGIRDGGIEAQAEARMMPFLSVVFPYRRSLSRPAFWGYLGAYTGLTLLLGGAWLTIAAAPSLTLDSGLAIGAMALARLILIAMVIGAFAGRLRGAGISPWLAVAVPFIGPGFWLMAVVLGTWAGRNPENPSASYDSATRWLLGTSVVLGLAGVLLFELVVIPIGATVIGTIGLVLARNSSARVTSEWQGWVGVVLGVLYTVVGAARLIQ